MNLNQLNKSAIFIGPLIYLVECFDIMLVIKCSLYMNVKFGICLQIVEDCDGRFGENIDELVDMVAEVFPLPNPIETNDGVTQEAENGAQPS